MSGGKHRNQSTEYEAPNRMNTNVFKQEMHRWVVPHRCAVDFDQAGIAHAIRRSCASWKMSLAREVASNVDLLCVGFDVVLQRCNVSAAALDRALTEAIALEEWTTAQATTDTTATSLFDAYACATWTSCVAMAKYLLEINQQHTPLTLALVKCQHSEFDLSGHFEGAFFCPYIKSNTSVHPVQQLLRRALLSGGRGWLTILKVLFEINSFIAVICTDSVLTSILGLHASLQSQDRPPWNARLFLQLSLQPLLEKNKYANLLKCEKYIKESLCRTVSNTLSVSLASCKAASLSFANSIPHKLPPHSVPSDHWLQYMRLLSLPGFKLYDTLCATPGIAAEQLLDSAGLLTFSRRLCSDNQMVQPLYTGSEPMLPIAIVCGKRARGVIQVFPSDASLISFTKRFFSDSYMSNHMSYWIAMFASGFRPQHLNAEQSRVLHYEMNDAFCLLKTHYTEEIWKSSIAWVHQSRSNPIATIVEVVDQVLADAGKPPLTIESVGQFNVRSINGRLSAIDETIYNTLTPKELAAVLFRGVIAEITEKLLVIQLSNDTKQMQISAIVKRYKHVDEHDMMLHNKQTHLHVCTCCWRVCNCVAPRTAPLDISHKAYLQVGTYKTNLNTYNGKIYCANKKQPKKFSNSMTKHSNEMFVRAHQNLQSNTFNFAEQIREMKHDGAIAARMRRDAKRNMHGCEFNLSCGDQPLLSLNILGKMIYTCGEWHTLCAYCSNIMIVQQGSWYNKYPCCQHCVPIDNKTTHHLGVTDNVIVTESEDNGGCRLCGAKQSLSKPIHSPLDDSAYNKYKTHQNRFTRWCANHYIDGLESMLQTQDTCAIMAHIIMN